MCCCSVRSVVSPNARVTTRRLRWELTFDGDAGELVPKLTRDVLVHTWDLARAVEADDRLDPQWCALFLSQLPSAPVALSTTGMFAAPVAVADEADAQTKLLARLGRDPAWRPPDRGPA
jgi:hypothetical protein